MTYEKHEQPQGLSDGQAGAKQPPIQQMHEPSMQQPSETRVHAG